MLEKISDSFHVFSNAVDSKFAILKSVVVILSQGTANCNVRMCKNKQRRV